MRIVLEVDGHDNGITTGTLWDLLDDLKATEQIKDYQIEPLEVVAYSIEDGEYYLDKYCKTDIIDLTNEQRQAFAAELNERMYDRFEDWDSLWGDIRWVEAEVADEILKEWHWLKEGKNVSNGYAE